MKKALFILCTFLIPFQQGFAIDLDSLVGRGNEYYMDEAYEKAVESYEAVLDSGYASAELYFNLGNAYFKSHDITMALVNYERARIMDPHDEEIRHNLDIAREFVVDRIDVLPEFFLVNSFRGFVRIMAPDSWSLISLTTFMAALLLLLLYFFSARLGIRRFAFWTAVLLLAVSLSSFVFAERHNHLVTEHRQAIIHTPSVTIKSSPDADSGTDLFLLHEGTLVTIEDELGEWREVVLSDGNRGWLRESDLIRL